MYFWFGLGNPRSSQECPNIFYQSLKIYDSVQMGVPLWLALLQLFGLLPTEILKKNIPGVPKKGTQV